MTPATSRLSTLAIVVSLCAPSYAQATHCIGTVGFVEAYRDGNLMVNLSGDGVRINRGIVCNLRNTLGPVLPETCRVWASLLQAGKLSGRSIDLYVTGAEGDMSNCDDGGQNTTLWFERVESILLH